MVPVFMSLLVVDPFYLNPPSKLFEIVYLGIFDLGASGGRFEPLETALFYAFN